MRLKPATNLILLATDSRESRQKAKSWRLAARKLGISIRSRPDRATTAILPCSDHTLTQAAWLCQTYNVPGPSVAAAAIASSKALTYEFLRSRGFEMLFYLLPLRRADLHVPFNGPIIVKPERGSGSYSALPWGYRVFDSMADFRRFLRVRKLEDAFLDRQWKNAARSGGDVIMEYIEAPSIRGLVSVSSDESVESFTEYTATVDPATLKITSAVYGERIPGMDRVVGMLREFVALGLRRSVLMVQCVAKQGKLHLIDLNFRTSPLFDRMNGVLQTEFYEKALLFMIGRRRNTPFSWPAPRAGVLRHYAALGPGNYRVRYGPDCIPLVNRFARGKEKPYDYAYLHPAFGLLCNNFEDFEKRAAKALSELRIEKL